MGLRVLRPGVQTLIQGAPRSGLRHWGVPSSGPADPLSHALANRLTANALDAPALEIALGGAAFETLAPAVLAITGADAVITLDGARAPAHQSVSAPAGSRLEVGPARAGARIYLAVAGGVEAAWALGSPSTYAAAGFGGHHGRALAAGDVLAFAEAAAGRAGESRATPASLRPVMSRAWGLRACHGPEFCELTPAEREALFATDFHADPRSDRMGVRLVGPPLDVLGDGRMASGAVFPGTVQCPPDGRPMIMGADAQTTGGYARVAHIARVDRHLIGQIAPNDGVRLLHRTPEAAAADFAAKRALLTDWLGGDAI